jgi:hypothetical protein
MLSCGIITVGKNPNISASCMIAGRRDIYEGSKY